MSAIGGSGDAPERVARINLDAFEHNVRVLSAMAAPAETMLAVKADAYGHGLVPLAQAALAAGARSLAVLDIPAALELRASGITAPIFAWMHGPDADFGAAADADIDLGISAVWQIEAIARAGSSVAPRVHLKIDTGLHRNGATVEDWPGLVAAALAAARDGSVTLYAAWSHLADASPADDAEALGHFRAAVAVASGLGARFTKLHLAASSAGIRMPEARLDLVRFGIAAYGVTPFDDETALQLGLRPVMTLVAPIVSVKKVGAGHGVSYGFDYRTSSPTTLVLVPLGYADGVPRAANGRAEVLIGGRRFPIAGRIAMDQFVVDVGSHPVQLGDEVVVFGEVDGAPTAEEWAGWSRTIGDEIVARVGPRVRRQYVRDAVSDAVGAAGVPGVAADGAGVPGVAADGAGAVAGAASVAADSASAGAGAGAVERWVIGDPDEMHAFGAAFASRLAEGDVLVLTGELGAGKTTFTRGLGQGLGVRGSVTSPTFVLARTHPNLTTGVPLVHVDAYRLGNAAELDDLDIDFEHSIVVVEWGSGMIDNLVDRYLELVIERPRGDDRSAGGGDVAAVAAHATDGTDAGTDTADASEAPVEPRILTLYVRGIAQGAAE